MLQPNKVMMNYRRTVVAKHPNGAWNSFYIEHGKLWSIPSGLHFYTYNQIVRAIREDMPEGSLQSAERWQEVTNPEALGRDFFRLSNGLFIKDSDFLNELTQFKAADNKTDTPVAEQEDSGALLALRFPKYWKPLPASWKAIDTYRVNELFPIHGDDSGRLLHARKKLLVPGTRTGGKTLYVDIAEAHATLGAWLADNQPEARPVDDGYEK